MVCESHFMLWESEPQNLTTDWLDLCIKTGDSLSVGMKLNELKFVDGIAPTMQKTRVPLFVYEDIVDIDYLMALARSKCARWFQVGLDEINLHEAVLHEIQLWRKCGWSFKVISRCFCHSKFARISSCARSCIASLK